MRTVRVLAHLSAGLMVVGCAGLGLGSRGGESAVAGHFVVGSEVVVFQPCGADEALWLTSGDRAVEEELFAQYSEVRSVPLVAYEEVYVELVGHEGPQLDCAFCEGYPGSFYLEAIVTVRRAMPEDCQ